MAGVLVLPSGQTAVGNPLDVLRSPGAPGLPPGSSCAPWQSIHLQGPNHGASGAIAGEINDLGGASTKQKHENKVKTPATAPAPGRGVGRGVHEAKT